MATYLENLLGSGILINVAVAGVILPRMLRADLQRRCFLLYFYCSLHFAFASIPVVTGEPFDEIVKIHAQGGSFLHGSVGAFMIAVAIVGIVVTPMYAWSQRVSSILGFSLLMLIVSFLLNLDVENPLQIKNSLMTCAMLVLAASLALVKEDFSKLIRTTEVAILTALLALMLSVAFFEIHTLRTWSVFMDSSGAMVRRPSALLFNPNLYGYWCALLAILFSFLYSARISNAWVACFALTLACLGIYLSGSRSAVLLLFPVLIIAAILSPANGVLNKFVPVALITVVLFFALTISNVVSAQKPHDRGLEAIAKLGDRFVTFPKDLANYISGRIAGAPADNVPNEVILSIEGRFSSELRDSGWLVFYDDFGSLGSASIASLVLLLSWSALRTYVRRLDVASAYALATWIFVLGLGAVARFQVFPTGIFVGLALAPCIALWQDPTRISFQVQKRN